MSLRNEKCLNLRTWKYCIALVNTYITVYFRKFTCTVAEQNEYLYSCFYKLNEHNQTQ